MNVRQGDCKFCDISDRGLLRGRRESWLATRGFQNFGFRNVGSLDL